MESPKEMFMNAWRIQTGICCCLKELLYLSQS